MEEEFSPESVREAQKLAIYIGDYLFEDLMRDSYDNSGDQSDPISPNMVGRQ